MTTTEVLNYFAANKLSVNTKKTNFMLITSPRKKVALISIVNFERKTYIKYLGVYLDHVENKVAIIIGILYKLRCRHTPIHRYVNYAVVAWRNTHVTQKGYVLFKINVFAVCSSLIVESQLNTCVFAHKISNTSSSIPPMFHSSLTKVS